METLQLKLGHVFRRQELLQQALTHKSMGIANYERLEFLGDSLLNFVTAQFLYENFPRHDEGALSRLRSGLVRESTLLHIADRLELNRHMQRTSVVKGNGIATMLADGVEAIFGAVLLDAGDEIAKKIVRAHIEAVIKMNVVVYRKDNKTALQEILQAKGHRLPVYTTKQVTQESFDATCFVEAYQLTRTGIGNTRKAAEQAAAEQMIRSLPR